MSNSQPRRPGAGWTLTPTMCALAITSLLAGCSRSSDARADAEPEAPAAETLYVARLQPLNQSVTGSAASGEVSFAISGDRLTLTTDAEGLPPGMTHWQHFHGFADGRDAACPTEAEAGDDRIVDLIETEPVSGTTMVPFNDDPVAMDVPHGSYPQSTATGAMLYEKTVSLDALRAAFGKAFGGRDLNLDTRVVFLHGVPSATELPRSVASLGPIPAHVTLPIACGEIRRVR